MMTNTNGRPAFQVTCYMLVDRGGYIASKHEWHRPAMTREEAEAIQAEAVTVTWAVAVEIQAVDAYGSRVGEETELRSAAARGMVR